MRKTVSQYARETIEHNIELFDGLPESREPFYASDHEIHHQLLRELNQRTDIIEKVVDTERQLRRWPQNCNGGSQWVVTELGEAAIQEARNARSGGYDCCPYNAGFRTITAETHECLGCGSEHTRADTKQATF